MYSYDRRAASKNFWSPVTDEDPKKIGITWVRPGNQRDGEAHAFAEATFDDGSTVVNNVSLCGKSYNSMAISKARAHGNTSSAKCSKCEAKAKDGGKTASVLKQAETYDRHFMDIVKVVDDLTDAAKKIPEALRAVTLLGNYIEKDPEVAGLPGLNRFAPEQQVGYLRESLENAKKAIDSLASTYDDANGTFMQLKLR